ncbi:MAG: hypothetical protein MK193_12535 [Lentisphaeria bacterium]|nr:hypothetical protein [Lentisphaeria bacterium]
MNQQVLPKYEIISEAGTYTFQVSGPLFCPYYNADENGLGSVDYYRKNAFTHNPFTLPAKGCSGSPVIRDREGRFWGFMNCDSIWGVSYSYDGKETLTVTVPEGQKLYTSLEKSADLNWLTYNKLVTDSLNYKVVSNYPKFWDQLEYCTWVEQKYVAQCVGPKERAQEHISDKFIRDYVDKLNAFDYPKGKLTLDHGWNLDSLASGFGTWEFRQDSCSQMQSTVDYIRDNGHIAGLWIGFPKIHAESNIAKQIPQLVGEKFATLSENGKDVMHYLADIPALYDYAYETIERFYKMGFMKFKIDMSYHKKHLMKPIHQNLYNAAKAIDPHIEMEFHVPDIFLAQYADVIRTNDVWVTDDLPWWQLTNLRYEVCTKSAPGRIINRDHVGGNDCRNLTEKQYLAHLDTYKQGIGYPLISMLPNHISPKCVTEVGKFLWNYHNNPTQTISEF